MNNEVWKVPHWSERVSLYVQCTTVSTSACTLCSSGNLFALHRINNWVEENTNNLIEDLIPDGVITPLTRLVLVNTLYFKAPWTTKFTELKSRTFQSPTGAVEVPYIYNKSQFKVFENTNTMYVAVPYSDGSTYFVIAMPKNDKGERLGLYISWPIFKMINSTRC